MPKKYFIGAGLSAYFSQLLYWREGDLCIYPSKTISPYPFRRANLEINKLFSSHVKSIGSSRYDLKCGKLHDRPTLGGNSKIWGGFFDTSQIFDVERLVANGVRLVPLSYEKTGSMSNISSLVQLQEVDGKILNAANHLRAGCSKYLDSIHFKNGDVELAFLSPGEKQASRIAVGGKIFVCTGVVQTIDLLLRSGIVKRGDVLTLDEFDYELSIGKLPSHVAYSDACVISYATGRAAAHMLGFQEGNKILAKAPSIVHQIFYPRKKTISMLVDSDVLISSRPLFSDKNTSSFGRSIHYCNLTINGESLINFSKKLSSNLHFVSMASVSQLKPGPISSDIFKFLEKLGNEL